MVSLRLVAVLISSVSDSVLLAIVTSVSEATLSLHTVGSNTRFFSRNSIRSLKGV